MIYDDGSKGKYVKKQGKGKYVKKPGRAEIGRRMKWCRVSGVVRVMCRRYTLFVFLRVVLWLCGDGAGAGVGYFFQFFQSESFFFLPVFCDKFLLRK